MPQAKIAVGTLRRAQPNAGVCRSRPGPTWLCTITIGCRQASGFHKQVYSAATPELQQKDMPAAANTLGVISAQQKLADITAGT